MGLAPRSTIFRGRFSPVSMRKGGMKPALLIILISGRRFSRGFSSPADWLSFSADAARADRRWPPPRSHAAPREPRSGEAPRHARIGTATGADPVEQDKARSSPPAFFGRARCNLLWLIFPT